MARMAKVQLARIGALGAALAAMAALAPAAPAVASAAPAGRVYAGSMTSDNPFALQLSADRTSLVSALAHVQADCEDGSSLTWSGPIDFADAAPGPGQDGSAFVGRKLGADGSFAFDGTGSSDYGPQRGAITQHIAGRITGARASGTMNLDIALVDKATGQQQTACHSGPITWTARSGRGRYLAGLTDEGRPVVVELTPSRRKIKDLRISWSASCKSGSGFSIGDHLANFPLGRGGAFGDRFPLGPYKTPDGNVKYAYTVSGKVRGTRASGSLRASVTYTNAGGAVTDSCSLRPTHWSAIS